MAIAFTALSVFAGLLSIVSVVNWPAQKLPSATDLCVTGTGLLIFIVAGSVAAAMVVH